MYFYFLTFAVGSSCSIRSSILKNDSRWLRVSEDTAAISCLYRVLCHERHSHE
jgi:hypothetical protein